MNRFRVSLALLVMWLAVVHNVERVHEPINISSFVYILTGVLAMVIICLRGAAGPRPVGTSVVSLAAYFVLKWWLGYEILGEQLPITVTECCVIAVTNWLAWHVARGVDEFEHNASDIVAMHMNWPPTSFEQAESDMYNEVQRARRFNRILSLATVRMDGFADNANVERLMKKVRKELVRKYLNSRLAKMLTGVTASGDLVAYRNGEFVLLMPEMHGDSVRATLQEVIETAREELGVSLQVGVAEFPEEEITFSGLVERAEAERRGSPMPVVHGTALPETAVGLKDHV